MYANTEILKRHSTKLGMMGTMGNKGAIITTLKIYDSIFKFCACHLCSGQGAKDLGVRIDHLNTIIDENFREDIEKRQNKDTNKPN